MIGVCVTSTWGSGLSMMNLNLEAWHTWVFIWTLTVEMSSKTQCQIVHCTQITILVEQTMRDLLQRCVGCSILTFAVLCKLPWPGPIVRHLNNSSEFSQCQLTKHLNLSLVIKMRINQQWQIISEKKLTKSRLEFSKLWKCLLIRQWNGINEVYPLRPSCKARGLGQGATVVQGGQETS